MMENSLEYDGLRLGQLVDLNQTLCKPFLEGAVYPWLAIPKIGEYLAALAKALPDDYIEIQEGVWAAKSAEIAPSALIKGPAIIGRDSELRQCAFIRENVIIGDGVTVGNSCEIKNAILFNGAQIPHFSYVGDSILGHKAHMGAGAIISNFRTIKGNIKIRLEDGCCIETGLRKFGAVLGDFVEIGSNAVVNPGSIVGRGSVVYPLVPVRGVIPPDSIVKSAGAVTPKTTR